MQNLEKRILKQKINKMLSNFIKENISTDEELLLALLYINEQVALDLCKFSDIFETQEEE